MTVHVSCSWAETLILLRGTRACVQHYSTRTNRGFSDLNVTSLVGHRWSHGGRTFLATPCSSSLAAVRLSVASLASLSDVREALIVPLHPAPPHTCWPLSSRQPAPPHGLSGQLPLELALPWPPHTWRENNNNNNNS